MNKKIDIIIPTTGKRIIQLEECIESLKQQTQPVNIVIVLGTVQPKTKNVIEELCRKNKCKLLIEPYKNVKGSHRAVACNFGLQNTKSEFVGFVDDDVTVPPTWAEASLKHFEDSKFVAGVTSGCKSSNSPFHRVQLIGSDSHSKNFQTAIQVKSIPGYNSIYRRIAINAVGNFNEQIGGCEDWELNYRLRGASWTLLGISEVPVEHRHTYTQQSFMEQMIGYGWSRSRLLRTKQIFTPMHAVPTIGMFILPLLLFLNINFLFYALGTYIILLIILTLHIGVLGIKDFAQVVSTFIIMHLAWGYGYLKGLIM